jgi:hypothetical protein
MRELPAFGAVFNRRFYPAYLISGLIVVAVYWLLVLAGLSLIQAARALGLVVIGALLVGLVVQRLLWGRSKRVVTVTVPLDLRTAYVACERAVRLLEGVVIASEAPGEEIVATTSPTWRSPGEAVKITLSSYGVGSTEVNIESTPRYAIPLIDYGKNVANVRRIRNELRQCIGSG